MSPRRAGGYADYGGAEDDNETDGRWPMADGRRDILLRVDRSVNRGDRGSTADQEAAGNEQPLHRRHRKSPADEKCAADAEPHDEQDDDDHPLAQRQDVAQRQLQAEHHDPEPQEPLSRPRTRLDALFGEKAYSLRGTRAMPRARGVRAAIARPSDRIEHRKRRGSAGGRPPRFDSLAYKGRNVIKRSFNDPKQ